MGDPGDRGKRKKIRGGQTQTGTAEEPGVPRAARGVQRATQGTFPQTMMEVPPVACEVTATLNPMDTGPPKTTHRHAFGPQPFLRNTC